MMGTGTNDAFEGVLWFGVLLAVLLGGALILAWTRQRLNRTQGGSHAPFSLDELRRMRGEGRITEAEYLALRQTVIEVERSRDLSRVRTG